jgi:hypothetical protein
MLSDFFVLFPLSMAMEKEQRRPHSLKIAPVSMKASFANATLQGMKNRSHFRRDTKIVLQQDVCVLFYLVLVVSLLHFC